MEEFIGNWYILLSNLNVEKPFSQLGSGVSIRRLDGRISVFDLAAAGAVGFREWAMLEPFLPGCVSEIETAQDAAVKPGYDALNRAWLASALLKLKGYNAHLPLACSVYSWNVVAGHQERTKSIFREELKEKGIASAVNSPRRDLPPFKGQLLELHTKFIVPDNAKTTLLEEDVHWISNNYEIFNSLAAESESFRFALTAAVDWQYSSDPRVAIAQLWSGIEAVFGISSELVYRISLLIASLLEPRGVARQTKFDHVRKLYGIRSKAVHGEELSDDKLTKAMLESFDILKGLILLNVEKGRPFTQDDFEEALFY
jgi:hypothetical protein